MPALKEVRGQLLLLKAAVALCLLSLSLAVVDWGVPWLCHQITLQLGGGQCSNICSTIVVRLVVRGEIDWADNASVFGPSGSSPFFLLCNCKLVVALFFLLILLCHFWCVGQWRCVRRGKRRTLSHFAPSNAGSTPASIGWAVTGETWLAVVTNNNPFLVSHFGRSSAWRQKMPPTFGASFSLLFNFFVVKISVGERGNDDWLLCRRHKHETFRCCEY